MRVSGLFRQLQLLRSFAPDIEMVNCQYGNADENFITEWGPIFVFIKCIMSLLNVSFTPYNDTNQYFSGRPIF